MAMAAAAATVCVASPSASSFSTRPSSWECGRTRGCSSTRAQIASFARTRVAAVGVSSAAAVPSSGKGAAVSELSNGLSIFGSKRRGKEWRWQAVAEQMQAASEAEGTSEEGGFPSDSLAIFLEAEGSLAEASVAKLTTSLESIEGVSNVDITSSPDGTATVRLTKQMSVQSTGVASGLVDILIKGGFKLQALNLGFDEENQDDDELYEYEVASSTEDSEAAEYISNFC